MREKGASRHLRGGFALGCWDMGGILCRKRRQLAAYGILPIYRLSDVNNVLMLSVRLAQSSGFMLSRGVCCAKKHASAGQLITFRRMRDESAESNDATFDVQESIVTVFMGSLVGGGDPIRIARRSRLLLRALGRRWREGSFGLVPADWKIQNIAYAVGRVLDMGKTAALIAYPFAGKFFVSLVYRLYFEGFSSFHILCDGYEPK